MIIKKRHLDLKYIFLFFCELEVIKIIAIVCIFLTNCMLKCHKHVYVFTFTAEDINNPSSDNNFFDIFLKNAIHNVFDSFL